MQIMSLIIRSAFALATLFVAHGSLAAASALPLSVELSDNRIISAHAHQLDLNNSAGKFSVRLPSRLGKAVSSSAELAFPESHSMIIDGREFVLLVVGQFSGGRPTGYCGAGVESKLYVLEVSGMRVSTVFEKLIQSCIKNMDLETDGVDSALRSVSWNVRPPGIRIRWMSDENGNETTRVYYYNRGRFLELSPDSAER